MVININSKIFQNKFLNPYMKTIAWAQNCWLSLLRKIALISGLTLFLHSLSIISQSTDPRNLLTCDINTSTKPPVGYRFNPHAWISLTYTTHRVNIVHLGHQIAPIAPRNLICASTKPFIHNVSTPVSINTDNMIHGYLINYLWMCLGRW